MNFTNHDVYITIYKECLYEDFGHAWQFEYERSVFDDIELSLDDLWESIGRCL